MCIVQPNRNAVSETFMRAHAERLPARVTVVHGKPAHIGDRSYEPGAFERLGSKLHRKLTGGVWIPAESASFAKALRQVRPDVVLAQYGLSGALLTRVCRALKIPFVVHFHGYDASRRDLLATHRQAYAEMFADAEAVIAVSRAMERQLMALGAPAEKLHYSTYGVDCERFSQANPAAAEPVFLSVGRFTDKKAPHLTLLAFARVAQAHPEARLRMIGEGELLGACRDLAAALKIESQVTFLGAQPHEQVQQHMQSARAFVQHSVVATSGDSEGTPVAVLEAGASGLPVVATRHAGIPDVVIEEETGLLVEERDVETMAEHLLRLARDPQLARRLGQNARQHITQNFSMDQSIARLWSILQRAAGSPKR